MRKIFQERPHFFYSVLQILILLAVFLLHFQQNLTAGCWLLAGIWGLLLAWTLPRPVGPRILPRKLKYGLLALGLLGYLSLHLISDPAARSQCTFNFFYVVGQYALIVWLFQRYSDRCLPEQGLGTGCPWTLQVLSVLGAAGIAVVLIGLAQHFLQIVPTEDWIDKDANPLLKSRAFSTWQNPNILAGYLCMLSAYLMAFLSVCRRRKQQLGLMLYLALTLLCLVYTYSRGFWIAEAVTILCFIVLFFRRGWYYAVGAAAAGLLLSGPVVRQRLLTITSVHDTSMELRQAYVEIVWDIIKDHPWGIGWNNYANVFPAYDFFFKDPTVIMYHCHNLLLNITAELGWLGLFLFVFCWGYAARQAWRLQKRTAGWQAAVGRGYLLMSISIFIGGLGDHVLFNPRLGDLFWVLTMLTAATAAKVGLGSRHFRA